jgi:hypothetical protein
MSLVFSDVTNNLGIVQQVRSLMRVDANQWPTYKIVNSVNNYLDTVTGYALGADRRFQWDDTNHSKLPEGTAELTINVSDYSFLTDEQANPIVTLLGISILQNGKYTPLTLIDRNDPNYDPENFGVETGIPTSYDKIADNIIRLDRKPTATVASGLKFYFQRTPSYFTASDTTKTPGVSPLLHRGFVIAAAYDGALTLGLKNLQPLLVEKQMEEEKMVRYFSNRNRDQRPRIAINYQSNK